MDTISPNREAERKEDESVVLHWIRVLRKGTLALPSVAATVGCRRRFFPFFSPSSFSRIRVDNDGIFDFHSSYMPLQKIGTETCGPQILFRFHFHLQFHFQFRRSSFYIEWCVYIFLAFPFAQWCQCHCAYFLCSHAIKFWFFLLNWL